MSSSPGLSTRLEPSCELSATTILRGFLRYFLPAIATRPSDITGYFVDATETAVLSLVFSARNARELPLPLAEGRAKSPWPSEPRRHGGVDAAAQRRPSRPLKIRGNLVSPDRSVAFWDFNRRMVRQVGGALFAGITTLPRPSAARTPMFWALPQRLHSVMLLEALKTGDTMGEDCRAVAPFFHVGGQWVAQLPTTDPVPGDK